MRVITGVARGTRLEAPAGLDTRPTSDMCKEAIFSILQFELEQAVVLDLFAGSGQLGIEALSRGAKRCVFVDSSRPAQQAIQRNLMATKLASGAQLIGVDALSYLRNCREQFTIALLDPPYGQGLCEQLLPLVAQRMQPNGAIVCETERDELVPEQAGVFSIYRSYRYGKAKVTVYRIPEEEED